MSTKYLALPTYQYVGRHGAVMSDSKTIAANVVRERERKGWSTAKLAREVGVALNTIQAVERGDTKKSKYLPDIARVLDVPLSKIDPDQAPNGVGSGVIPKDDLIGRRDLPIYATTEGGEGVLVMSSEPVDLGDRPSSLAHVRDAYGVIVTGESMAPIIRPGDIAVIHPHKQPRREDLCVFRAHRGGEFHSTIKEFVSQTKDLWRVRRYQPEAKEFTLKRTEWQECHVVVAIHRR